MDQDGRQVCTIMPPPPRQMYCQEAQFTASCGEHYLNINRAYGRSALDPRR